MKTCLLLGLDGAGKTLLLRQLALQLLRNHKSVVDRIVALAQSASCLGGADAVTPRGPAQQSASGDTAGGASTPEAIGQLANSVLQNAIQFASSHPSLALVNGAGREEKTLDHDTQPTVGVEHTPLTIDGKTFSICEVGGQLLPMWKAYFDASEFWIYVVDVSNPVQLAGAAIEFFNIMKVEAMRKKPKLLLLNKIDACFTVDDATVRSYLCLDKLMTDAFSPSTSSGPMHVLKISASSGENVDAVLKWISQRWHNNIAMAIGPSPSHVSPGSTISLRGLSGRVISFNKPEKQRIHPVAH